MIQHSFNDFLKNSKSIPFIQKTHPTHYFFPCLSHIKCTSTECTLAEVKKVSLFLKTLLFHPCLHFSNARSIALLKYLPIFLGTKFGPLYLYIMRAPMGSKQH